MAVEVFVIRSRLILTLKHTKINASKLNELNEIRIIGEGGFGKVSLVNRGAEFYAQKQVLKKKTSALEVELEKEIMTSDNQFIVKLHGMISDYEYHYFLMGKATLVRPTTFYRQITFRGMSRR